MWNQYPKVDYNGRKIVDISRGFVIQELIKKMSLLYYDYEIEGWKSPEDIAYDVYGSVNDAWLIFVTNGIIDPYYDWLLSDTELVAYCKNKYGIDSVYNTHHYELDGVILPTQESGAIEVTNYDYEMRLNEAKRKIKIIRDEYVSFVKDEYRKLQSS